jgi:hypothetical protein
MFWFVLCDHEYCDQSAKYEFASSNTTRTAFVFDACFVWKLTPLADERNGIVHRISIATINAIDTYLTLQTHTWPTDGDGLTTCYVNSICLSCHFGKMWFKFLWRNTK